MYHGGDILTMNGDQPAYAEAVVVENGVITFTGRKNEADRKYSNARSISLEGKTMLPGFIDAHSHFSFGINSVSQANLSSPPAGTVTDYATLIATLEDFKEQRQIPDDGWVVGWGYDPNGLKEKKHMTKFDLDAAFPTNKVMLIHVSGHGAVLNSMALEWAGIDSNTETPAGGVIARMPGGNDPAGLLMETAYLPVFAKLPKPTEEEILNSFDAVQRIYTSEGYTHAQDGALHADEYAVLQNAAAQNKLYIDIAALAVFTDLEKWLVEGAYEFRKYNNHLKLEGIKFVQDGSPQGKTALMTKPYLTGGPDGEEDWYGEPTLPKDEFVSLFKQVADQGFHIFVHTNGDGAIDHLIAGVEAAGITSADDRRVVSIHSQFQRPEHLADYKALGITPSYFTNHVFYWGDEHIANQGIERASFISPIQAAVDEGLIFSNHTDFNVTPTDAMHVIWTAVKRQTRSGKILGADQCVSTYTALQGLTTGPAYQMFEENRKGMIKEGLLADFVILDNNPLKVNTDEIRGIEVMETIKEGETVYRRE